MYSLRLRVSGPPSCTVPYAALSYNLSHCFCLHVMILIPASLCLSLSLPVSLTACLSHCLSLSLSTSLMSLTPACLSLLLVSHSCYNHFCCSLSSSPLGSSHCAMIWGAVKTVQDVLAVICHVLGIDSCCTALSKVLRAVSITPPLTPLYLSSLKKHPT